MWESSTASRDQIPTPDVAVARLAAERWGVLSLNELLACGLTKNGVAARVRVGRLHRVHRGVYAVGHAGLTMRGRFLAAVKACGDGSVLSHVSAAVLWDLLPWDEARPIDVIATERRRLEGVRVHRTRSAPPTILYDHIPVTTPARTLTDLSSMLPFKTLRRAAREALALKRITPKDLQGTKLEGPPNTRSELEDIVLDLLTDAGLPQPEVNKPLPNGLTPDFRWPSHNLILEADGAAYHDHPLAQYDDAQRQAELEKSGYKVLRISYLQAVTNPHNTIRQLKESLDTDPAPTESPAPGSPPTPAA